MKPPRASTKGDTSPRRPKPRGATQGERADKLERRARTHAARSASVVPTDQFVRITDEDVVEVADLAAGEVVAVPARAATPLRVVILEAAAHLATAQAAVDLAGHAVAAAASGTAGIEKMRPQLAGADAVIVALPGGERLIEAALALGSDRPVVIAALTADAVEAVRRASAAGADLATTRPHDVERLAPVLLGAARLREHRRLSAALAPGAGVMDDALAVLDALDLDDEGEPGNGLQSLEAFATAVDRELARATRFGYPLSIAMFGLDVPPPPPPSFLRGLLRARTGNAVVHAVRDIDLVTELEHDRFLVLMPYTDRLAAAEVARRVISAVASADPVTAAGRTFPPRVTGAVAGARAGEAMSFATLLGDVTQLLEQASVTGASLAVES